MKVAKIAVQLYSFKDHFKTAAELPATLRRIRALGYEAVELSPALPAMPEADLNRMLADAGLRACGSGERAAKLVAEPQAVIEHLRKLGCSRVVYPYPHEVPADEAAAVRLAKQLNAVAETYRAAGITVVYHNHAVEFRRLGRRTMLEIFFAEAPALQGELDTFWIQHGGGNPVSWIQRLKGRMPALHLKEFGIVENQTIVDLPVGDGNLEWDQIIPAAEAAGVEWFVVEHEGNCPDPFESFRRSFDFLTANFVK